MTVWRGFDSLRGFGGKEGPLMTEILILFSFSPQTGVTRSGNSAQQKALHLFSRGLGVREGPLMAEIYIFCFPIFPPNMSGISGVFVFSQVRVNSEKQKYSSLNTFDIVQEIS